jgi:very-short-patch-repair endonuclease
MRAPILTFKRARALRRDMSLPEVVLWECLRGRRLNGLRFRRQHPIGPYILDFYCSSARLAVEVDGAAHDFQERARHDKRREAWLGEHGVRVLRFTAQDVLRDEGLEGVLTMIAEVAAPSTASGGPLPRFAGEEPAEVQRVCCQHLEACDKLPFPSAPAGHSLPTMTKGGRRGRRAGAAAVQR